MIGPYQITILLRELVSPKFTTMKFLAYGKENFKDIIPVYNFANIMTVRGTVDVWYRSSIWVRNNIISCFNQPTTVFEFFTLNFFHCYYLFISLKKRVLDFSATTFLRKQYERYGPIWHMDNFWVHIVLIKFSRFRS